MKRGRTEKYKHCLCGALFYCFYWVISASIGCIIGQSTQALVALLGNQCKRWLHYFTYFFIAAKLSLLITCSILQASSVAISSGTPRRCSHEERNSCLS